MTDDRHTPDEPIPRPDGGVDQDDETLSEEEQEELLQEIERRRSLTGFAAIAVAIVGISFSAFQMWLAARGQIFRLSLGPVELDFGSLQLLQLNAIHVMFALILAFLLFPATAGDGFFSSRFARVAPALRSRLGARHPVTRGTDGVRRGVRWFMVDDGFDRVTPIDLVLILLSILSAGYIVTEFKEIQNLRVFGLEAGRPVSEMVLPPFDTLASLAGIGDLSYAFVLGAIGVLLVLEATRRTLGVYLMLIVTAFIVYARFGFLISTDTPIIGVLATVESSSNWPAIVQNLWYNTENGVFGIPVTVSVQFIYIFILFGAFLETSGAGKWFIDLAYAATGTRKGGPAKASILASGFMGTISGSSIANTVTTGAFTIPLMKRSGYRAEFAGAVESSASSGGQILPPVMGAAAFLMVGFLGVPFTDIITAAAIPAVVFFFGVWVMVHLEASRVGIGGLRQEDIVELRSHFSKGWFYLVPIVLLLYYLLVAKLSVSRSAWFTLVAIMALVALVAAYNERTRIPLLGGIVLLTVAEFASYLVAGTKLTGLVSGASGTGLPPMAAATAALGSLGTITFVVSVLVLLARPYLEAPLLDYDAQVDLAAERSAEAFGRPRLAENSPYKFGTFVLKSMDSGARTATEVVIAVAAAGIIPGVVSVTGLGPNLVALIKAVSAGSIVLLLLFTAVSAIILGMGMPTTVTYIILSALLAPAIVESSAIPEIAAHLFILYFGVIADITPPVAVAAYAASGIAKSDPFQTGVQAFSLSLNKAIVPFAFALTPGILLIQGTGADASVVGLSVFSDPAFLLFGVIIPVAGVFLGVVALGATVIGYLYGTADRGERALFAFAALLLMAPTLLLSAVGDVTGLGLGGDVAAITGLDLVLRVAGGVLFGALTLFNRRNAEGERQRPADATATTD
ncbi:TRAP transporter permease [Halomarina litorea]|uniref:TRAP transporter permease n=1 Tax=Halomarina litorea TaxID=2961595 RepID=UPI0020C48C7D|nr:TRAP transporter fused permease subunit [Halomarina sp. BCD28]